MSSRAELHAARRRGLVARSERLRQGLRSDAAGLAVRLRFADRIVAVGRSGIFKVVLGGAAALLLSGRAGSVLSLASRIAMLYPVLRRAVRLVSSLPKDASPQP
ncbi:MAG TPA: hypothetical protein VKG05_02705 [Steroidobacteraceae bacterium]|nr:hypothetical protein [Steroidobacteraceae bacterium]